jgi:F-type H+-transporting ATPase subunit delta
MMQFIGLLVTKYREKLLADILRAAIALIDEREGRVDAHVASAVPLHDGQKNELRLNLERVVGKQVTLDARHAPEIGGGFIVRVGDTVFDGSLGAQLAQMRALLVQTDLRPAVRTS